MGDTLKGEKGSEPMESVEEVKRKKKGKESRYGNRYGFELKLRCVKLRLEEGLPVSLLSKELGVSKDVVYRWVKAYQERGEAGLRNQARSSGSRRKLPGPVRKKMGLLAEGLAGLIDLASFMVDLCYLRAIDPRKTNCYFCLVVGSDLDGVSITDFGDETFDDRLFG